MTKSLMHFILRSRFVHQRLILCADVVLSAITTFLTYLLTDRLFPYEMARGTFWEFLIFSMVFSALFFWLFRTYKGIIRHSSLLETLRILAPVTLAAVCTSLVAGFLFFEPVPGTLLVLNTLLDILFTFLALIAINYYFYSQLYRNRVLYCAWTERRIKDDFRTFFYSR